MEFGRRFLLTKNSLDFCPKSYYNKYILFLFCHKNSMVKGKTEVGFYAGICVCGNAAV